jgi:integrase
MVPTDARPPCTHQRVGGVKGHRRRRGDAWELRVYAGRDAVTGKVRIATETFKGSAKGADERLRGLVAEVEAGEHGGTASSVGHLLNEWLDHVEGLGRSPTTMREYRRLVKRTVPDSVKRIQCRKLTARDLDRMYGTLTASKQQVHAVIRAALTQGEKWGYISKNVAKLTSREPATSKTRSAPGVTDVTRMITRAQSGDHPDQQIAVLIGLAAVTGARRGELCELRWKDVDFKAKTVTISRSVAVLGRGRTIVKDTKTHAARILSLDPSAVKLLRDHHRHAEKLARAGNADPPGPDSPILTYDGVRSINPDYASHQVRDIATVCGVDTHLHALRHQAATQMVGAGVNISTVAGRLGHGDSSTTLRIYSHALPEKDREAAALLGKVLPRKPRKKASINGE